MDPHSRLSQFNHRVRKAGPQSRRESIQPPKDSFKMPSQKAVIRRPIATNSRVKQDELFKRDMYLSFVSNALQQKTNVRLFLPILLLHGPYSDIGLIRHLRRARRTIQHLLFKSNLKCTIVTTS